MPEFVEISKVAKDISTIVFYIISAVGIIKLWRYHRRNMEMRLMERLTQAKTALANGNESVRISAIQATIQVARESKRLSRETSLRIRNRVTEDICSYVHKTTKDDAYRVEYKEKPSDEIQSMLTQAFVQNGDVFEGCEIDLQDSYLRGVCLRYAQLRNANFSRARLQYADFMWAQMQGADLSVAQMQRVCFYDTQLQEAKLSHAKMQMSRITLTRMQGATINNVNWQGSHLWNVLLQGANLSNTGIQGTELNNVLMQGVQSRGYGILLHHPLVAFKIDILARANKDSHLDGITFSGGLKESDVDELCDGLTPEDEKELREKLAPHIDVEASHALPSDSKVVTGRYSKKDARRWIAKYNKGVPMIPRIKCSIGMWYATARARLNLRLREIKRTWQKTKNVL